MYNILTHCLPKQLKTPSLEKGSLWFIDFSISSFSLIQFYLINPWSAYQAAGTELGAEQK